MTKRIIGLILVVVMLTLSLVSCGYSFEKDDLSAYATLTEEQKTALLEKIKKITIEDGDFKLDAAEREKRVLDSVYEALASASEDKTQNTKGVPGVRDLVYYCYYVTAEFDGTTELFNTSYMKQSSAVSVQLGKTGLEGVAAEVARLFGGYDFTDAVYKSSVSGKTKADDKAYVSYTVTETVDGKAQTSKKVNAPIIIAAAPAEGTEPASFESYLCGKSIATAIKESKTINGLTYSDVTINWVSTGENFEKTFTEVTYTEDKNVTNTNNVSRNLKDKALTYHIFPVHFVKVPEYTGANIVNILLGEEINEDAIYEMLFGEEWAGLDEEEDKEKIEKRAEKLLNYKTTGETSLTIADLVDKILNTYTEEKELQESYDAAVEDLSDLEAAVADAEAEVKQAETPSEELNKALEDAKKALAEAEASIEKTKASIEEKGKERENHVSAMLAISVDGVTVDTRLVNGYKILAYNYLQDAYNTEIKMKLAKEIYYFLENEIKVTDVPEKAVKATYDRLVENYEYEFYTGSNTTTKVTYYKENNGSFKKFLIKSVNSDYTKTFETYDEALAFLKEEAKKYVEPIVRIYVASKAFDVLATKEEFKEYKKDTDNNYSYNEYYYGENSVRYAYQFDKLMNHFLAYEEVKAEAPDANGYTEVTFKYTLVEIVYGEPESEKKAEETAE